MTACHRAVLLVCLAWFAVSAIVPAEAAEVIEAFVQGGAQLLHVAEAERIGAEVHIHDLDAVAALQTRMSQRLPADKAQAEKLIPKLMTPSVLDAIARAWVGPIKAQAYGIDRYPALVFDGHAIVYGELDVLRALQQYRQSRAGR